MTRREKPIILITGAAGNIGTALATALQPDYRVVGLDTDTDSDVCDIVAVDLTDSAAVELSLSRFREQYGDKIASVVHLAAYFDFSGKESPLYEAVNERGTKHLLKALQAFDVEQFVYSSTMLVHQPCTPGERIDETQPIEPGWAYPESKARVERIIEENAGGIPYVLLRLAGLYDDQTAVPTLSHQIARIYERDFKSRLYSGDLKTGQSFLHREDMINAFLRTVDRRADIESGTAILVGESQAMSYHALQERIGELIHGEEEWPTLLLRRRLPKPVPGLKQYQSRWFRTNMTRAKSPLSAPS